MRREVKSKKQPREKGVLKCNSCGDEYRVTQMMQWEEDDGKASPFVCNDCYEYMLERWDGEVI